MNSSRSAGQLRITLIAGFILLMLAGGTSAVFYLSARGKNVTDRRGESFQELLRDWDISFNALFFTESEFDQLNKELDNLEEKTVTVESWLSVLKRRRALAKIHPPSLINYRKSTDNALKAYPSSQPIIALAASSLIKNTAINTETENSLRGLLSLLTDSSLNNLRLAIHIILGDLGNPQRAHAIPSDLLSVSSLRTAESFASGSRENGKDLSDNEEAIFLNMVVLKTIRRDFSGAFSDIQTLLNYPSVNTLSFAAEFYYDFGDLVRSAEIFSHLSEYAAEQGLFDEAEKAMIRQSDALYLAGFREAAEGIWKIMAETNPNETSLYYLAVTSEEQNTAFSYLEKLINLSAFVKIDRQPSLAGQYGLIRYSRFFDDTAALALLQGSPQFPPADYPHIDLEINKRYAHEQNPGRRLAETWLLLDRHEKNEDLYKWAAWYFFFQRRFDEAAILFNRIDQLEMTAPWINVCKAILYMNEGRLEQAEHMLRSALREASPEVPSQDEDWLIYANLGRLLEAQRSPSRALEQYETAVTMTENPKTASRIYVNMARCYSALNSPNDARRCLQYAVNKDADNHTARLELDRFY